MGRLACLKSGLKNGVLSGGYLRKVSLRKVSLRKVSLRKVSLWKASSRFKANKQTNKSDPIQAVGRLACLALEQQIHELLFVHFPLLPYFSVGSYICTYRARAVTYVYNISINHLSMLTFMQLMMSIDLAAAAKLPKTPTPHHAQAQSGQDLQVGIHKMPSAKTVGACWFLAHAGNAVSENMATRKMPT